MAYPPQGTITPGDLDLIKSKDSGLAYDRKTDSLEFLGETQTHQTSLFPEKASDACTFAAGSTDNLFSDWAEIADSPSGNKLTNAFATANGHITGILVEDLNTVDKRYSFEIAYGETTKTVLLRHRFVAGVTKKLPPLQFVRIRSVIIPAGEKVYYRMMCETGSAECEVSFRYHTH